MIIRRTHLGATAGLLLALLLQACASVPAAPPPAQEADDVSLLPDLSADAIYFGTRPRIPTAAELHRLEPSQQEDFLDYFHDPYRSQIPAHHRVADYLQDITDDFHYDGVTLDASTALAQRRGDCLSLAILTTALARLAGVEIGYQLMDDEPVFEFNGSVISKGVHVRSLLYKPGWEPPPDALFYIRPFIKVDYFPSNRERIIGNLSADEYTAMYYRNIAARATVNGDYGKAWWFALESLRHAPTDSSALNTLAVVYKKTGHYTQAEAVYRFGIEQADENLSLLKNYRLLLSESGRDQEARRIEERLMSMDDPSPFHWFHLARSYYQEGDYKRAIRYYREALERAPYLHQAHLGIARSYYRLGLPRQTGTALARAMDEAVKASDRARYQEKLAALSR